MAEPLGGRHRASPIRAHARALTTASAKASADCGFCPVTKLPETTTCDVHGSTLVYLPPLPVRPCSFDPEKGFTASVWPTYGSASSEIHNPVGCSPIWPALVLTRRTFLAMVCDLRAWLCCVASFSRDFLSLL